MKIICIGQSTLDISMPLEQPVIENYKYKIYGKLESAGGPSTNAAILLGRWGINVTLVSRLGNDLYASHILDYLKASKVKHIAVPATDFETPISVILTNKVTGLRTIFNAPGKIDPSDLTLPNHYDLLLCDGHEPEITHRFLDQHPDILSVIDAGGYRQTTIDLAKRVTWLVSSQVFAETYAQVKIDINDPKTWVALYQRIHELNSHPIVTLGEQGCLYEEYGRIHHMPAFPAHAIDTNGAGDIFHGAFVYGLAHGKTLKETLTMASMTSSISVTRRGGSLAIPSLDEVLKGLSLHTQK